MEEGRRILFRLPTVFDLDDYIAPVCFLYVPLSVRFRHCASWFSSHSSCFHSYILYIYINIYIYIYNTYHFHFVQIFNKKTQPNFTFLC
jgi:hypothetical protein